MDASKVKVSIDCWWHLQVCRILLAARSSAASASGPGGLDSHFDESASWAG